MSGRTERHRRQRGLTLVELVLSVVIISIAVGGVTLAYITMIARSADPLIDVQAVAVAEAYMDEILARPVSGPPSGGSRDTYGSIGDYDGLSDSPPADQFGNPIPALAAYSVAVSTGNETVSGVGMMVVQVTVSHTSGRSLTLRSHRSGF